VLPQGGKSAKQKKARIGFDYVHSLVDDHSRLAYSEVLPDEKGPTCAAFLQRAIAYFATHGITSIERLVTDNAWAYRGSLRQICAAHGIKQKFIKPLSATLENEADPTLENEATGSWGSSLPGLGF
jgi:transposase InsO family protein